MNRMKEQIITVEGLGRLSVPPDAAVVEAAVAVVNASYTAAGTEAHRRVELLRVAIVPLGFDRTEFKTTDFGVTRETEHLNNPSRTRFAGYGARHTVELRLPLEKARLNRVVEACLASGAEAAVVVRFTVLEPETVRNRLLAAAVANARQRAEVLTAAAGVKLGEIAQINYGATEVRFLSEDNMLCDGAAPPEIEASDFSAEERVQITWRIA
jgi:uncharacterized protein YggE